MRAYPFGAAYFTCLVRLLYNLLYMQVTMQLTCAMSVAERARWRRDEAPTSVATLDDALALVLHSMDATPLYVGDQTPAGTAEIADREELENQIQSLCLPFLRIAALLRHHLYEQELPKIHDDTSEFVVLVYHLELVEGGMPLEQFNAAVALSWPEPWGCHMAAWSCQLAEFVNRSQVAARSLLSEQHVLWHQPRLLSLPELYDRIFQYYHRRQCGQCHSVPRETSICLVCGTLVCLKENCCKHQNVCEAVQHSVDCGAGTAMYLVVTSSYVIVIRGKRACLWGSVYLDSFGEEDRELKRGKPLYLSPGRYQLLQQQWLGHHFDHTPKKWVWHREAL